MQRKDIFPTSKMKTGSPSRVPNRGPLKDEPRPLDWTEMLNEEAVWHDYADFHKWFSDIAPGLPIPEPPAYVGFCEDLDFIRREAANIYFGLGPDIAAINLRLIGVALEIDHKFTAGTRLPTLLAKTAADQQILDRLFGALLVGFAQFVAENQSGGPGLCRCQGVFRDTRMADDQLPEYETRYRKEIELLEEKELIDDPAIQRCADFFVGRSKARFCSDACRFMTFQISKQLRDPGYLAEKQRRYRNKRKDST